MHPTLIELAGLRAPTYGVLLALGFLAGTWLVRRRAPELGLDSQAMVALAAFTTLAGVLGSRSWFVVADWQRLAAAPWRAAALWQGGAVWYGALCAGLLALFLGSRRAGARWPDLLDLFLPAASLAHLFGRIGCFAAGCCWGDRTALPWAVTFPASSACGDPGRPLHPTQLYEAFGEAAIGLVLLPLWRRRPFAGAVGLAYLLLYGALRFGIEPLRAESTRALVAGTPLSIAQLVSLALVVLAAAAWCLWSRSKLSRSDSWPPHRSRRPSGWEGRTR